MDLTQSDFVKKYTSNVRVDLSVVAYTKVPKSWQDNDYTPDFNKLYFIVEGEGYVKLGDRIFYPSPGDLYLLPAGHLQSYGTVSANTFGKYWCHFRTPVGHLDLFQLLITSPFIHVENPAWLTQKFEQLVAYSDEESLSAKLLTQSILLEIVAFFLNTADVVEANTHTTNAQAKIHDVLHYIEAHLSDKLSVQTLAEVAHFHPNYLIRLFKSTIGVSPIHYVNHRRVDKAKHLLRFTNHSVIAISDAVGLELSYFSRMFKDYTGFTPTDYRELLADDISPNGSFKSTDN